MQIYLNDIQNAFSLNYSVPFIFFYISFFKKVILDIKYTT